MFIKQSIALVVLGTSIALYAGLANANEIEVKTGNMEVSVQDSGVTVTPTSSRVSVPSLLNRLNNLRFFNQGSSSSSRSSVGSDLKCDRVSSGHHDTNTNSSGTAVSQSSSSSTTMTCN